jgi:predicted acyltransferase
MLTAITAKDVSKRLLSLDVMRGLVMILLAAESCAVYESLNVATENSFLHPVMQQFFHHPWHGIRFWDLVQPAFMTMAGSAMYISYFYKLEKGIGWAQNFKHIFIRCIKLFICGTALHCVYSGKLVWELWNVLTQLSITTLIAYAIIQRSAAFQIGFSIVLLLITEIMYRFILMPGFDQPFVDQHNFGNWLDMILMGKINAGGWVAINIIPTAAHTIWGAVAGKLLMSKLAPAKKVQWLIGAGIAALILGFGLDAAGITPIIKRIATSSFALVSVGWVLLLLGFLYWLIDIQKINKYSWVFVVVGTNAIFIYLFFETVGPQWLNNAVGIFVKGFTGMVSVPLIAQNILSAFAVLLLEWSLCYWMWKKKIFIKL